MTAKFGMTAQKAIKLIKDCGLNIEQPLHDMVADCIVTVLEKQIQKKPVKDYIDIENNTQLSRCPICGNQDVYEDMNYCDKCGQALDWSGENDPT